MFTRKGAGTGAETSSWAKTIPYQHHPLEAVGGNIPR